MSCATQRRITLLLRQGLLCAALLLCAVRSASAQQNPEPVFVPEIDFERRIERLEAELAALKAEQQSSVVFPEMETWEESESPGVTNVSGWSTGYVSYQETDPSRVTAEDADPSSRPPGFRDWLRRPESSFEADQYPTLEWSGFLQLDTGIIDQDELNVESVGIVEPESGLRRVRLRVDGNVRENSSYVIDLDFAASGHPSFRNVLLAFHEIPVLQNIQMGYFKQSIGLQAMESSRDFRFLERTLPFAFDPFRQTGIGAFGNAADRRISWAISTYGYPTDSFGVTTGDALGTSLSTRVTGLPFYADEGAQLLHMGFGYAFGNPGDNIVQYAIQPGFFVVDPGNPDAETAVPTFVNTGKIPARAFHTFNTELATNMGSFSIRSEATFAIVDQIGGPTTSFSGAYASAGYVLTGEKYRYNRRHGIFRRIVPDESFSLGSGGGAWEITAGWSYINLNDQNIQGGRMTTLIVGLNWYVSPHSRFILNVIPVHLDDPKVGRSDAVVSGVRAQVEF